MNRKFALLLVVLLVLSTALTACSSASKDAGKDYMEAVMTGETDKAEALACDGFEGTADLIDWYASLKIVEDSVNLKVDMSKGNNEKELRVTGSFECGRNVEFDCGKNNEFVLSEKRDSLIILEMEKEDGDWCVSADSEFHGTPLMAPEMSDEEPADSEPADSESTDSESTDSETDNE